MPWATPAPEPEGAVGDLGYLATLLPARLALRPNPADTIGIQE